MVHSCLLDASSILFMKMSNKQKIFSIQFQKKNPMREKVRKLKADFTAKNFLYLIN